MNPAASFKTDAFSLMARGDDHTCDAAAPAVDSSLNSGVSRCGRDHGGVPLRSRSLFLSERSRVEWMSFMVNGFAFSDPRSSALISGKLLLFRSASAGESRGIKNAALFQSGAFSRIHLQIRGY